MEEEEGCALITSVADRVEVEIDGCPTDGNLRVGRAKASGITTIGAAAHHAGAMEEAIVEVLRQTIGAAVIGRAMERMVEITAKEEARAGKVKEEARAGKERK